MTGIHNIVKKQWYFITCLTGRRRPVKELIPEIAFIIFEFFLAISII